MRFDTATLDDLKTILVGSVFRYKGEPILVHSINKRGGKFMLDIAHLGFMETRSVVLTSRFLDFSPVPLGFCNTAFGAVYVMRKPSRTYRQGLGLNNAAFSVFEYEDNFFYAKNSVDDSCLTDTILGNYPKRIDAIAKVRENKKSVAFSRTLAITAEGFLFYKQEKIGCVDNAGEICLFWNKEHYKRVMK